MRPPPAGSEDGMQDARSTCLHGIACRLPPSRGTVQESSATGCMASLLNICKKKLGGERNYTLRHFFFNYSFQMRFVKTGELYPIATDVNK